MLALKIRYLDANGNETTREKSCCIEINGHIRVHRDKPAECCVDGTWAPIEKSATATGPP